MAHSAIRTRTDITTAGNIARDTTISVKRDVISELIIRLFKFSNL